jgi:transcriptional regulator with XRE-family HTH domain
MQYAPADAPTGLDLRVARTIAGVSQTELARRLGWPRQRVTWLESLIRPSRTAADAYRAALRAENGPR